MLSHRLVCFGLLLPFWITLTVLDLFLCFFWIYASLDYMCHVPELTC